MSDRLQERLDLAGQLVRDGASAVTDEAVGDEEQLAHLVQSRAPLPAETGHAVDPQERREPASGHLLWVGLAAAAAILLFVLAPWRNRSAVPADLGTETGEDGRWLGSAPWTALAPKGEVEGWGSFRWTGQVPRGGWFELVVSDGETGERLARIEELSSNEWTPLDSSTWSAIEWQLTVYEASGDLRHSFRERAHLRSR